MFTADSIEILVLVENWVDMLLADIEPNESSLHCVSRAGLIHHFDSKFVPPAAENGLSMLVTIRKGRSEMRTLFDVGLTGTILSHNLNALNQNPDTIDNVVISHGHPDHYGGIHKFLEIRERPVSVMTHEDAFLPRYAVMADGRSSPFYNSSFNRDEVERGGGRLSLSRDPVDLGWGALTTGEISRDSSFEGPRVSPQLHGPGLYQVNAAGAYVLDEVWDEQGLVINVANEGLVILTGCAHAGVVNTVMQAKAIFGDYPIKAVIGGFHLGFPTTPKENISKTLAELRSLDVQTIMPMHCSGLAAHAAFSVEMPDRYIQPSVGSVLHFGKR